MLPPIRRHATLSLIIITSYYAYDYADIAESFSAITTLLSYDAFFFRHAAIY